MFDAAEPLKSAGLSLLQVHFLFGLMSVCMFTHQYFKQQKPFFWVGVVDLSAVRRSHGSPASPSSRLQAFLAHMSSAAVSVLQRSRSHVLWSEDGADMSSGVEERFIAQRCLSVSSVNERRGPSRDRLLLRSRATRLSPGCGGAVRPEGRRVFPQTSVLWSSTGLTSSPNSFFKFISQLVLIFLIQRIFRFAWSFSSLALSKFLVSFIF